MKFEITMTIEIEDDSNKLEVGDTNNLDTISNLIESVLYDIDDLEIEDIDVVRRLD